jgi:hypothetical protein
MARKLMALAMVAALWFYLSPAQVQADFIGIVPGSNTATIVFDDTANGGGIYQTVPGPGTLPLAPVFLFQNVLDLATGDSAGTAVNFDFGPKSAFVSVPLTSFLDEPALGLGATIIQRLEFSVTLTTDAGGVPAPFFTYAGFRVAGSTEPGGFAQFDAQIDFTSGVLGLLDTRTLNFLTPPGGGAFDATLLSFGAFVDPVPFDTLTLSGFVQWQGDPFRIETTALGSQGLNPPGAVPEPSSLALLVLSSLGLLGYGWRRRQRGAEKGHL